jgi:thiamine biosynthesis lipoprotein
MKYLLIVLFFYLSPLARASDTPATPTELVCSEQTEMGTPFKICVYVEAKHALNVKGDFKKSFSILHDIDHWMSEWRPDTQLSRVNLAAGAQAVKVTSDLFEVIQFALQVAKESDGAFDPTFNALWGLYNFKKGEEREPTDEELKERLDLINYKNVELNDALKTVFLSKPGMKLGLGGLGQGYGVDKVVAYLRTKYTAGYVDGSGDTYFWGKKPNGELWRTGIRDPFRPKEVVATIYGTDFSITTSGDDEKFFFKDGVRVHHLIDPKTGRPSMNTRQATVIAPTAFEADSYDTASFIMGPKKALALLERKKLQAVIVGPDKKVHFTKGLKAEKTPWGTVYKMK